MNTETSPALQPPLVSPNTSNGSLDHLPESHPVSEAPPSTRDPSGADMSPAATLEDGHESRHPPNRDPVDDSSCGSRDNTTCRASAEMRDGVSDSGKSTEKSSDITAYDVSHLAQTALMVLSQRMPTPEQEHPQPSHPQAGSLTGSSVQTNEYGQESISPVPPPDRHVAIAQPDNGRQPNNLESFTPEIRQNGPLDDAAQTRVLPSSPSRAALSLSLPSTQVSPVVQQLSGPALAHLYNATFSPPIAPEASKPAFSALPLLKLNPLNVALPGLASGTAAAKITLPSIQEFAGTNTGKVACHVERWTGSTHSVSGKSGFGERDANAQSIFHRSQTFAGTLSAPANDS
jgi:hypothetical protein